MSGYPYNPQGYGYGPPSGQQPYSSAPPSSQQPYSSAPPPGQQPYAPVAVPYGAPSAPYAPTGPGDHKPPKDKPYGAAPQSSSGYPQSSSGYPQQSSSGYPQQSSSGYPQQSSSGYPQSAPPHASGYPPSTASYGSPFASLVPSAFPPGTDPNVVACFQLADQDGSGFIDDKELQKALSSYNQSFSLRTVHLLMYLFTNTNARKIGPKEFTAVFYSLQNWRAIFERFDRDRSGKIDPSEPREALLSLGFAVSPTVLDLLVSKFDKSGGKNRAIEYDNFIECCLSVKGLTEKFKEKDNGFTGSATFTYEAFMLSVLPFLIA
ncbi:calcium-binding protein CBP-like [Cornus florida]|uniref:calcium-binding protein CBP-like n=1 Tax=Cornus florida TaxID=4283 RepID=UPI0028A06018|nr:calcium-binding protein CBP-like [Cornus florida]